MASKIVFQPGIQTMALSYTMSVCDYSSRETRITASTLPARDTDMKFSGERLNMESRNLVFDSRCVNLFKKFKTARPKPNNVWSALEHLGTHEQCECGDPWSEL